MDRVNLLIEIIFDDTATIAEKEDALMCLEDFKVDIIEDSLIKFISNVNEDRLLRFNANESLLIYWKNKKKYNLNKFKLLPKVFRVSTVNFLKNSDDEWTEAFEKANNELKE